MCHLLLCLVGHTIPFRMRFSFQLNSLVFFLVHITFGRWFDLACDCISTYKQITNRILRFACHFTCICYFIFDRRLVYAHLGIEVIDWTDAHNNVKQIGSRLSLQLYLYFSFTYTQCYLFRSFTRRYFVIANILSQPFGRKINYL